MAILDIARRIGPFVLVFAAGLWLWRVAESYSIATRLGRAGPELWPKIVLLVMIGAAVWGAIEAFLRRGREEDDTSVLIASATRTAGHEEDARKDLSGESEGLVLHRPIFSAGGMLTMLAYVAALPYLGFTVSTFALLLAIMLLAGYRRPLLAAVIAVLGSLAFFIVFQRIVYVSLPHGAGPFKELTLGLMALIGVR